MTSILERLDDLIRESLHRFVDRALENNSLALFDQDVRDMESAIGHVKEATVNMYAAARANERRLNQHQEDVERLERRVARLTEEGVTPTSERVMVAQAELETKRGLVDETRAQIERQQGQYETLKKSVPELEIRAQTLHDERPHLESLLILTGAYRSVERVELTLEGLRGLGGDTDVATIADGIYQRFNKAQSRLDLSGEAIDLEIRAEMEQVEVEDQLEKRRQRLGLETEEEEIKTPSPPPAAQPPAPDPAPDEPDTAPAE